MLFQLPHKKFTDWLNPVSKRIDWRRNMLKVDPHPDYPPEDGRYLRRNDFSPVAVAIILNVMETESLLSLRTLLGLA